MDYNEKKKNGLQREGKDTMKKKQREKIILRKFIENDKKNDVENC